MMAKSIRTRVGIVSKLPFKRVDKFTLFQDISRAISPRKSHNNNRLAALNGSKQSVKKCKPQIGVRETIPAGTPRPRAFEWFVRLDDLLSEYPDQLNDGPHHLAMQIADKGWSESIIITLTTKQASLVAEINTSVDDPKTTKIVGAVKAEGTGPNETLRVNIYFDHHGKPEWVPLDVTRKINKKTGEAYFIFATDILKLPTITPRDPRYEEDFFMLEIIDKAGTITRQSLSYNLFATPGKSKLGIQGPKAKALIELVVRFVSSL